jgi:hypothetical protein
LHQRVGSYGCSLLTKAQDDRLEVLMVLVNDYKDHAFPVSERDPIELLHGHMLNSGRTQKDLADLNWRRACFYDPQPAPCHVA